MKQKNTNIHDPNPHSIKRSIQRRAKWLYVIFSLLALAVFVQIVLTQYGPNGAALRNKSEDLCYTTRRVQGNRGNIYDRNGEILSTDSRTYNIRLDLAAEPLSDELFNRHVGALADSLGRMFGKPSAHYRTLLQQTRQKAVESGDTAMVRLHGKAHYAGARYKLLARHLNQREYDRLRTFPLMERRYGMIAEEERMRYKVYGSLAAYTISQGVEKAYDSLLRSTDGVNRYVKLDNRNRSSVPIVDKINRPATNGCDIITTIDINLQDVVEGALRKQLAEDETVLQKAYIHISDEKGDVRLSIRREHLVLVESADNYVCVYYLNNQSLKKMMIRNTLRRVAEQLEGTNIVRCHRSYVVNFSLVAALRKEKEGVFVEFGIEGVPNVPISRTYGDNVRHWMEMNG